MDRPIGLRENGRPDDGAWWRGKPGSFPYGRRSGGHRLLSIPLRSPAESPTAPSPQRSPRIASRNAGLVVQCRLQETEEPRPRWPPPTTPSGPWSLFPFPTRPSTPPRECPVGAWTPSQFFGFFSPLIKRTSWGCGGLAAWRAGGPLNRLGKYDPMDIMKIPGTKEFTEWRDVCGARRRSGGVSSRCRAIMRIGVRLLGRGTLQRSSRRTGSTRTMAICSPEERSSTISNCPKAIATPHISWFRVTNHDNSRRSVGMAMTRF